MRRFAIMAVKTLKINTEYPQGRMLSQAAECMRAGGVIAYPTDTTYGIGADLFNKKAIDKIYRLKPHKKSKELAFICNGLKDISRYALISDPAYRTMKRLIPGPYTFVLHATREVPRLVMTKRNTVGIRVPDSAVCLGIAEALGNPIITTSVTLSDGGDIFADPDEIRASIGHSIDMILDGGLLPVEASSVLDLTGIDPVIIRKGKGDVSGFE